MKQVVRAESASWITRVNTGLQMRAAGEAMVSKALRARLDKVGEKEWLAECLAEWKWGRSQAYAHLSPEGMERERERKSRPEIPDIGSAKTKPRAEIMSVEKVEPTKECPIPPTKVFVVNWLQAIETLATEASVIESAIKGGEIVRGKHSTEAAQMIDRLIQTLTHLKEALDA